VAAASASRPGLRAQPEGAFGPDVSKWDAWSPQEVTALLAGVAAPWYVAAGWAVDLFLGGGHRAHEDLEIATPRTRLGEVLAAFPGLERFWVGDPPGMAVPFEAGQPDASHQTWLRVPASGAWRLDVLSEPSEGDTWICRRDPSIRMPYARLIERTPDGIPYGRPEVMLLFKAKAARPKDDEDFAAALPLLDEERRRWLADALARVHPGHRWLTELLRA
jgi:aminoglycoside-2''-adenylyltransferase